MRVPTAHGTRYTVALHMENFLDTGSETKRFVLRHLDVRAGGRTYPGTVSLIGAGIEPTLHAYETTEEVDRAAGGAVTGTAIPWSRVFTRAEALSFMNDEPSAGRADLMTLTVPQPPDRCIIRIVSGFASEQEVPLRLTG